MTRGTSNRRSCSRRNTLGRMSHERLRRSRGPKPTPAEVKRCRVCRETLILSAFDPRTNGGQGVEGTCKSCIEHRYQTGMFKCSRCNRTLPGPAFFKASGGHAVMQPCKECRSAASASRTRLRRLEHGRAPYHLLSEVDVEARTAMCRECGPTHIYATGSKQGRGWRCGTRSDEVSDDWYDTNAEVLDKHASKRWHRLTEVRGDQMLGTCTQCGRDVPFDGTSPVVTSYARVRPGSGSTPTTTSVDAEGWRPMASPLRPTRG